MDSKARVHDHGERARGAGRMAEWYERAVALYPGAYLARHRGELLQNYEDLRRDLGSGPVFFAFIVGDLIKSLTMQYMQFIKRNRWAQVIAALIVIVAALGVWQIVTLQKAHSSFANYAAFRGCTTIVSQSDTSGTCTLASGLPVSIVKFNGRWFLKGDLPVCMIHIGSFCLIDQP